MLYLRTKCNGDYREWDYKEKAKNSDPGGTRTHDLRKRTADALPLSYKASWTSAKLSSIQFNDWEILLLEELTISGVAISLLNISNKNSTKVNMDTINAIDINESAITIRTIWLANQSY